MNGKRAKLVRKMARMTGANYRRLKGAWKAQNHQQRAVTRLQYGAALRIATERGYIF